MTTDAQPAANRWPPQIKYIVGNEACERFSYYGMRSILAGYITGEVARGGLGQDADTATSIIHTFVFVNYFIPLFGRVALGQDHRPLSHHPLGVALLLRGPRRAGVQRLRW